MSTADRRKFICEFLVKYEYVFDMYRAMNGGIPQLPLHVALFPLPSFEATDAGAGSVVGMRARAKAPARRTAAAQRAASGAARPAALQREAA